MKAYGLLVVALLVLSVMPLVMAVSTGGSTGINIQPQKFAPKVWMCDYRVVLDDATEPGRISEDGQTLVERINNYAFEGEQIQWKVLVMDKNGIEKLKDVFVTLSDSQEFSGDGIEANCHLDQILPANARLDESCNARIGEEVLSTATENTMAYYTCTFTVERGNADDGMYGQYWVTVEADDLGDLSGTMDENEHWFLNPTVTLSMDETIEFADDIIPGSVSYSTSFLVGNDADDESGVMMDMFISGTDFYDSTSSGAKCPTTNQLSLSNFRYYATNGAYSTRQDARADVEGYVGIKYGIGFNNPNPFYNNNEILQVQKVGPYYAANILAPGAKMPVTFKLSLPEPCNGNFDTGSINFWGEAI